MKRLFFALLFTPLVASAAPISIDLQNVPLREFIRLVYGQILQTSYVVDGTVQDDLKPVSLRLSNVSAKDADTVLRDVLASQGVQVDMVGGVTFFRRATSVDVVKEVFVYRPKYRSVQYLMDLTASMFPLGSFVAQRGGGMPLSAVAGAGAQGVGGGVGGGSPGMAGGNGTLAGGVPSINQGLNQKLDTEADALVFRGVEKDVLQLQKLLKTLDVATGEVMVKAVIYEVQTSTKAGSAIDLAVSILSGKAGIKLVTGAADSLGSAFVKMSAGGLDLSAVFSALSSDDRFKIVSAPRVRVRSGASSHFSVGDEVPILGSVSYDQTGRPIQSVNYKSSGVIFDIRPQVREEGVDLHLSQQISSFAQTTTGVNGSPTLNKRELSTDLTVSDSEVVVIGGLETDRESKSNFGFSFLPAFLRSDSSDVGRTEILLMLHVQRI